MKVKEGSAEQLQSEEKDRGKRSGTEKRDDQGGGSTSGGMKKKKSVRTETTIFKYVEGQPPRCVGQQA